jgi:hypothetical protein
MGFATCGKRKGDGGVFVSRVTICKQAVPLTGIKRRLYGQKNRTQKNGARIFLRSIFLPYHPTSPAFLIEITKHEHCKGNR